MKKSVTLAGILAGISLAASYLAVRPHETYPSLVDTAQASFVIPFNETETAEYLAKHVKQATAVYEGVVVGHTPERFINRANLIVESFKVEISKTYKGDEKCEIEFVRSTDRYKPYGGMIRVSTSTRPPSLQIGSSYVFLLTAGIGGFERYPVLLENPIAIRDGKAYLGRFGLEQEEFSDSLSNMIERLSIPYLREHSGAVIRATLLDHLPKKGVDVNGPADQASDPIRIRTVISDVYKQPSGRTLKMDDFLVVEYLREGYADLRVMWTEFSPFRQGDDVILFLEQFGDTLVVTPELYRKWTIIDERAIITADNEWPRETYTVESVPLDEFIEQLK